ncbi:hypothetical protein M9H77_00863 [Catharanthus roseus]|uniref:Uncharacterized protein n=1 Tax=Catharanthus roseus TaxID=4058 RepID=A0ACC0C3Y3_CATRO|nr:hypothetical protein M9H77_00863 [Catharanthus roseus]
MAERKKNTQASGYGELLKLRPSGIFPFEQEPARGIKSLPNLYLPHQTSNGGSRGVLGPRPGVNRPNLVPVYPHPRVFPLQKWGHQGYGRGGIRACFPGSRQSYEVPNRGLPLPCYGGGIGKWGGGLERNCGGTGVFLPKEPANVIKSPTVDDGSALAKKKKGGKKKRRAAELLPKKDFEKPIETELEDYYGLPKEWTY